LDVHEWRQSGNCRTAIGAAIRQNDAAHQHDPEKHREDARFDAFPRLRGDRRGAARIGDRDGV
jgi:hypothetical protein